MDAVGVHNMQAAMQTAVLKVISERAALYRLDVVLAVPGSDKRDVASAVRALETAGSSSWTDPDCPTIREPSRRLGSRPQAGFDSAEPDRPMCRGDEGARGLGDPFSCPARPQRSEA
jgi:hypothetical protein